MERQSVESSQLKSAGYDPENQILEIEFNTGSVYRYKGVDQQTFDGLMAAESVGRYFGQVIKPNQERFPFEKIQGPASRETVNPATDQIIDEHSKIICPYCGAVAKFSSTCEIYGRDYGMAYICANYPSCDAYVGVHQGTDKALGRMADRELREWKKRVHAVFDPYWKSKQLKRVHAYSRLARLLGIEVKDCHVGMFDVDTCKRAVELIEVHGLPDFREQEAANG